MSNNPDRFNLVRFVSVLCIAGVLVVAIFILLPLPTQTPKRPSASCCSANTCAIQHHHEAYSHAGAVLSETKLANWYAWYNETYFHGKLPKDTKIRYADMHAQKLMGITRRAKQKDDSEIFIITLDPDYNEASVVALTTLLHEMCHIATWEEIDLNHGPKFHAEVKRLEVEGAFDDLI